MSIKLTDVLQSWCLCASLAWDGENGTCYGWALSESSMGPSFICRPNSIDTSPSASRFCAVVTILAAWLKAADIVLDMWQFEGRTNLNFYSRGGTYIHLSSGRPSSPSLLGLFLRPFGEKSLVGYLSWLAWAVIAGLGAYWSEITTLWSYSRWP